LWDKNFTFHQFMRRHWSHFSTSFALLFVDDVVVAEEIQFQMNFSHFQSVGILWFSIYALMPKPLHCLHSDIVLESLLLECLCCPLNEFQFCVCECLSSSLLILAVAVSCDLNIKFSFICGVVVFVAILWKLCWKWRILTWVISRVAMPRWVQINVNYIRMCQRKFNNRSTLESDRRCKRCF
jgi:hypothetical protein